MERDFTLRMLNRSNIKFQFLSIHTIAFDFLEQKFTIRLNRNTMSINNIYTGKNCLQNTPGIFQSLKRV